jgi:hypothetical protein
MGHPPVVEKVDHIANARIFLGTRTNRWVRGTRWAPIPESYRSFGNKIRVGIRFKQRERDLLVLAANTTEESICVQMRVCA